MQQTRLLHKIILNFLRFVYFRNNKASVCDSLSIHLNVVIVLKVTFEISICFNWILNGLIFGPFEKPSGHFNTRARGKLKATLEA